MHAPGPFLTGAKAQHHLLQPSALPPSHCTHNTGAQLGTAEGCVTAHLSCRRQQAAVDQGDHLGLERGPATADLLQVYVLLLNELLHALPTD